MYTHIEGKQSGTQTESKMGPPKNTHTHTYIYIHIYTCLAVCFDVHKTSCMWYTELHIHIFTYIYIYMYISIHTEAYIYIDISLSNCYCPWFSKIISGYTYRRTTLDPLACSSLEACSWGLVFWVEERNKINPYF